MKKLKEFIKKIDNKKYCLLSLLLAGILIFAVLSGLNGSKSAVNKVNAISAPTNKNLDLNGVRYTYNTSLKELKDKYGLFKNDYTRQFFTISNTSESLDYILLSMIDTNNMTTPSVTQEDFKNSVENVKNILNDNIKFTDINNRPTDTTFYDSGFNSWNTTTNSPEYGRPSYEFTKENVNNLSAYNSININFPKLINDLSVYEEDLIKNYQTESFMITLVYLNNELDANNTEEEYYYNNAKFFNYVLSSPIDFNIKIRRIDGYSCRAILVSCTGGNVSEENCIYGRVIDEYLSFSPDGMSANGYIVIDNVKFIENSNANIISCFSKFRWNESLGYPLYQGNILLSTTNYDSEFIRNIINAVPNINPTIDLSGGAFFGGKFGNNKPIEQIYFKKYVSALMNVPYIGVVDNVKNLDNNNGDNALFFYYSPQKSIQYKNQNQLLYVEEPKNLRSSINTTQYNALSAQVQDILYNVEYVGNIQEEEFNQKVQDDLIDLLKTTGIGAVIGLLIGFLVGNPVGGLIVGAVIGFAVAIIPLIIDGLQAIFGQNFLSGLYNFFNAITEFFVNIIDKIVEFLLSIITNPFILVLIVLVAILYIFVIRPKIKQ